ncbi:Uncharacterized protein TCM_002862 [Theobroma cacao]|uniref:Uncharacterized protein n=1 Tax=Theobroma cacao TaxID=3641 RepID=A0A061DM33_THECC|nr:Uncharacterized protein TCM_002862 [Theobroma cacao]
MVTTYLYYKSDHAILGACYHSQMISNKWSCLRHSQIMLNGLPAENQITLRAKPLVEKQIVCVPKQLAKNKSLVVSKQFVENQIIDRRNLPMVGITRGNING